MLACSPSPPRVGGPTSGNPGSATDNMDKNTLLNLIFTFKCYHRFPYLVLLNFRLATEKADIMQGPLSMHSSLRL